MSRRFDLICLGRAAVDLYGDQVGGRLEDMRSFSKYLGGSPANTAVGLARLGLRAAMLTRVGDEHNGRFVRESLAAEGVDVSQVRTDPARLTALVFLGIQDRDTFPLIFYRANCADMGLCAGDIDPAVIADAGALLVSGTHLSQPGTRAACDAAIAAARAAGTRIVLDIDYRPVLWNLTAPGLGEQRYVESAEVSAVLQAVVPQCDLVVGTEEEIHIAGGSTTTIDALRRLRALTDATLVMKRGAAGCVVFDGAIPGGIDDGLQDAGFPIEVFNVLGAGDAFMAGFLRGWLVGEPLERSSRWGNACGALVVSRHGCAPAMPSWTELQHFLTHGVTTPRLREDEQLEHVHRATTRRADPPELLVLAIDHRAQLERLAGSGDAAARRIRHFKRLVDAAAQQVAVQRPGAGLIVDSGYGEALLPALHRRGWWIARAVEQPGSRPLRFEAPDLALELRQWPTGQVAKCLLLHHPDDDAALRAQQVERLAALQRVCIAEGRAWLLEVMAPRDSVVDALTTVASLAQLYDAGLRPDWWKLPAPSAAAWSAIVDLIGQRDPFCRGVLLLGNEADEAALARQFHEAAPHALCRGFAIGRSVFGPAARAWFADEMSDDAVVDDVARRYARLISHWDAARHPAPERSVA
ncbi:bifunctional 5-dehydro-2-deoxygluconokinase/5-dehydro-2-deoxyphosphogluconate aldolase [Aquabacterium humicola]|uniref:bifunctional 5-dehydro-2-deoxygluconokinase/5-dehydro-2- deoxyphosphogluconate aldolase n=1 Tax=Aquabacterium humicola TaxID=3237377 RepID=UPI002543E5FA|nr:5-dehydro-2-deoxygluconokinase [Rubrivivax pictus]